MDWTMHEDALVQKIWEYVITDEFFYLFFDRQPFKLVPLYD